jgi:hypothetical protein
MKNEVNEPLPKYNGVRPEGHIDLEWKSPEKHEYYRGEAFAMSGASINHYRFSMNRSAMVKTTFHRNSCGPFGGDLKICIQKNISYTYPLFSIVCDTGISF